MAQKKHFLTAIAALTLTMVAHDVMAEKVLKLGTVGRLGMPIGDAIDQALIPTPGRGVRWRTEDRTPLSRLPLWRADLR